MKRAGLKKGFTLRERAERALPAKDGKQTFPSGNDHRKLDYELSLHQIELEMQNAELRRAQEEAEEAREKYFDLFNLAPVGFISLAEDWTILEANQTAAQLLGMEKRNLLKKPFTSVVAPESQDAFYFHRKRVVEKGRQQTCELKLTKRDGKDFFGHLESKLIPNPKGSGSHIWMAIVDIDDRMQAIRALKERASRNELLLNLLPHPAMLIDKDRKILATNKLARKSGAEIGQFWSPEAGGGNDLPASRVQTQGSGARNEFCEGVFSLMDSDPSQQRLVTVVEDSNDAVTVIDLDGKIRAWNKGAEAIYGYSSAEARKMSVYELIPLRLRKEFRTLVRDVKSGVLVPPFETRRIAKGGCLLDVRVSASRLIQNGKVVAVATTERNLTEYNHWLAAIKELPHRIIMAQEAERERIALEIHSDLGQSLLALKMFLVQSASELVEKQPRAKLVLDAAKERLSRIIEEARELSHRLAPPCLKFEGLIGAIKSLLDTARNVKKLKVFFFQRNMQGVSFAAKDIILYRIVQEALLNILKHAKAKVIRVKVIRRDSVVSLEIGDDGVGFRPTRSRRERGLGLDLLKEQVVLLHGTVGIESRIGKGTVIKVTIPILEGKK